MQQEKIRTESGERRHVLRDGNGEETCVCVDKVLLSFSSLLFFDFVIF